MGVHSRTPRHKEKLRTSNHTARPAHDNPECMGLLSPTDAIVALHTANYKLHNELRTIVLHYCSTATRACMNENSVVHSTFLVFTVLHTLHSKTIMNAF